MTKQSRLKELYKGFLNLLTVTVFCGVLLFSFSSCGQLEVPKKDKSPKANINVTDLATGMYLNIADSSFNKIKAKREAAIERNRLFKSKDDYVYGTLTSNNKTIEVKARLKGDHVDHLKGERWSFRILSKDGTILNHAKISVQGVHTRGWVNEWIFHKLLEQEDLIHLQYEFFPFSVNDTLNGIYAFESHFDNHLLKMANRKTGPILKFDETSLWDFQVHRGKENRDALIMQEAQLLVCNKKWGAKKKHKSVTDSAIKLMNDFRKGEATCSQVFDLKVWARFMAVNELMRCDHALRWHNIRFYLNPATNKIEPIGFDLSSWLKKKGDLYFESDKAELFHKMMLKDENYVKLIQQEIIRLSSRSYIDNFFSKYGDGIEACVLMINKDHPEYKYNRAHLYQSQKRLAAHVEKSNY